MTAKQKRRLTPQQEIKLIQRALGYMTYENVESAYEHVDLGDSNVNEVFGDRELGPRVGCVIEVHGPESSGKTWLATKIAATAQQQSRHFYVVKGDLERTNDDCFNERVGIDLSRFYLIKAALAVSVTEMEKLQSLRQKVADGKKLTPTQQKKLETPPEAYEQSAEQVCDEIEALIKFKRERDPLARFVLIIDSVTGMLVREEDEGALANQNMRTKVALASFLSLLCRRWVRFAANYNILLIFINQERMAPGVIYGSPIVTSGGKALKFYSAVRVRVRRCKSGRVMKDKKVIGLRSVLQNEKNKAGGRELCEAAFKGYPRTGKWLWMTRDQAEKEAKKK